MKESNDSLFNIFCNENVHVVHKYKNDKHVDVVPLLWKGYEVHLIYPNKKDISVYYTTKMFKDSWGSVGTIYLQYFNALVSKKSDFSELKVWHTFITDHATEYP